MQTRVNSVSLLLQAQDLATAQKLADRIYHLHQVFYCDPFNDMHNPYERGAGPARPPGRSRRGAAAADEADGNRDRPYRRSDEPRGSITTARKRSDRPCSPPEVAPEVFLHPALVIISTGHGVHKFGRRLPNKVFRRRAVTQRLQRLVGRLHRRHKDGAPAGNPDAVTSKEFPIAQCAGTRSMKNRYVERVGNRPHLIFGRHAGKEHRVDALGLIRPSPLYRIIQAID